ncbi:MAG: hypothetical protein LBR43_01575 [Spiroplasmataceae bacterium]|nr:hypothetical protein [Spiroplasmataceae bacterium]
MPKNLPAWAFTNEEWYSCPQRDKQLRKAGEESWKIAKKLAQKEVAFADFESRVKVLEFISKHKYPSQQNREPFQKIKSY